MHHDICVPCAYLRAGGLYQGQACSAEQLDMMATVRPLVLADSSREEAQLDRLEPGFRARQAALEERQKQKQQQRKREQSCGFSVEAAKLFAQLQQKADRLKQEAATMPGGCPPY